MSACGPSARMFFRKHRHRKQHWRYPLMPHQFRPHNWYNVGHVHRSPQFLAQAIPCYPKRSHTWPSGNIHAVAFQSPCISCLALGDSWIKSPCITTSLQRRGPLPTDSLNQVKKNVGRLYVRVHALWQRTKKIRIKKYLVAHSSCTVVQSSEVHKDGWQSHFPTTKEILCFFCILKTDKRNSASNFFFPFVDQVLKMQPAATPENKTTDPATVSNQHFCRKTFREKGEKDDTIYDLPDTV